MTEETRELIAKFIEVFVVSALFILFGYGIGRKSLRNEIIHQTDTCTIIKSVVDSEAVLTARKPDGYELVRVCSLDSLKRLADNPKRIVKEVEKEVPVIVEKDSIVYIQVPMEERQFCGTKDSVTYRILTTGYNTDVTSVSFSYPERTITKVNVYDNTKKWGLGIAIGPTGVITPAGNVYGGIGATAGLYFRF